MLPKQLLIDTDVIIDYLRNHVSAIDYLEKISEVLCLSAISVAEIYAGIRDQREQKAVDIFLSAFTVIPMDNSIAIAGGVLRKKYGKSHGTGLADALIAATAVEHKMNLVTLNTHHYPMLKTIRPYKKT